MKKIIIWVISLLLFVGVIVGAAVLYKNLIREYTGGGLNTDLSMLGTQSPSSESAEGTTGYGEQNTGSESLEKTEAPDSSNYPETTESTKAPEVSETEKRPDFSAPDFTVLDENGNKVKLSDFHGKPIVLNFWATWCTYCVYEMPEFEAAYKKYPDVQFVMVNATDGYSETIAKAKNFIEKEGYSFDIFFDTEGEAISAYHVSGYPITFFINAGGEAVAYWSGMIDSSLLENGIAMIR